MSERARTDGPDRKSKTRKTKAPSEATGRRDKQHLDEILDEALGDTFPASDPVELTAERD